MSPNKTNPRTLGGSGGGRGGVACGTALGSHITTAGAPWDAAIAVGPGRDRLRGARGTGGRRIWGDDVVAGGGPMPQASPTTGGLGSKRGGLAIGSARWACACTAGTAHAHCMHEGRTGSNVRAPRGGHTSPLRTSCTGCAHKREGSHRYTPPDLNTAAFAFAGCSMHAPRMDGLASAGRFITSNSHGRATTQALGRPW